MRRTARHADRVLGILAGTALGDGLGAPFEGRAAVAADVLDRWAGSSRILRHTDDTAMTLALADHLARTGGIDQEALARDFVAAWRAEPWRGYGRAAVRVLAAVEAGRPWRQAAAEVLPGGSWGNGAAMRVAPVAVPARSLREAAELGRRSAEITHAHEHGRSGAAMQAAAVWLALHGGPGTPVDAGAHLDGLRTVLPSPPWQEKLERIRGLLRQDASPAAAVQALGHDVSALGSVPLAVFTFLHHADDPAAAVRFAVRCGGDTDTVAAMTGALAGARHGGSGWPASWVARLECAGRLPGLAERLATAARAAPDG